jgi:hypothetical protein
VIQIEENISGVAILSKGEKRRQSPEGCVRARSAIPIPAATDQHPTLVRLDKAFVCGHESSE